MRTDYRNEAMHFVNRGISVGPLKKDGTKLPAIKWKQFQTRRMTVEEVNKHFMDCGGIFAITGPISRLFLLDFDTKYDRGSEDTYQKFLSLAPKSILEKVLVNTTMSGGKHIWMRTDYTDKSRKVVRRELNLAEFTEKVESIMFKGANERTAMHIALSVPYECTLETRGTDSYGVISHNSYKLDKPIEKAGDLSIDEVELMLSIGYSLDCGFKKKEQIFLGEADVYKEICRFNDDCGAEGMLELLERSGMYSLVGQDYNGNFMIARSGSNSKHSGYVYHDTGVLKIFGTNLFDTYKDTLTAFDVYKAITALSTEEAVAMIVTKRKQKNGN